MKRYPIVIAATAAGLGTVMGFHPASTNVGIALQSKSSSVSQSTPPKNSSPSTTTTGPSSQTAKVSPTSTTTNPAPGGVASATGNVENYGYGQLSVKVTISNRKITAITLAQLQVAESYSQSIAQQVIPLLKNEVMKAQSLNVNGFTGATYTTEAYLYSLQSALNKLHFK
ncbi:MAG: FMN-binding protein [Firmicutes bacterium]|jgi:uncharacterized protein with FMN-binding domain|nr:FMN-binding protein [Bacillota bacterium]